MHPEMGTVELSTGTPSSAACTPTRLWLAHPSAGSCLPLCQNQSHLEQHLLMVVSLIGHQENCSIGNLQLACITTIKSPVIWKSIRISNDIYENKSPGILRRGQRIASWATSDGKQDLDASPLACSNVIAQPRATIRARVAMASQIHLRSLVISKNNQETNIDNSVIAWRAGISQAALIPILAPIDRYCACISVRDRGHEDKTEEGQWRERSLWHWALLLEWKIVRKVWEFIGTFLGQYLIKLFVQSARLWKKFTGNMR